MLWAQSTTKDYIRADQSREIDDFSYFPPLPIVLSKWSQIQGYATLLKTGKRKHSNLICWTANIWAEVSHKSMFCYLFCTDSGLRAVKGPVNSRVKVSNFCDLEKANRPHLHSISSTLWYAGNSCNTCILKISSNTGWIQEFQQMNKMGNKGGGGDSTNNLIYITLLFKLNSKYIQQKAQLPSLTVTKHQMLFSPLTVKHLAKRSVLCLMLEAESLSHTHKHTLFLSPSPETHAFNVHTMYIKHSILKRTVTHTHTYTHTHTHTHTHRLHIVMTCYRSAAYTMTKQARHLFHPCKTSLKQIITIYLPSGFQS